MNITCGDSDVLDVSVYPGSPESDREGITAWYQITNHGVSEADGIIAFPGALADRDKKVVYIEDYDGERTFVAPMSYNTYHDIGGRYYSYRYTLAPGETKVCRMMTEDK